MVGNPIITSFTIWDSNDDPVQHDGGLVYTWNGYEENGFTHSLLQYVETHGEQIRGKYLAWVHDLGESKINGKRVIDHLAFDDEFSYWWMSLIIEKSPWKSPGIIDAIRFIALEEIIVEKKPAKVLLVSANRKVNDALLSLCRDLNISYEWIKLPNKSPLQSNIKRFFCKLPQSIQALIRLARHISSRWAFRQAKKSDWFSGENSLFICSYFFNNDSRLAKEGQFHSHYWEGLHDLLRDLNISGNWLQNYYPHDSVPNPDAAMDWIQRFNRQSKEQGFHTFLDSFLTGRIVFCVFKRWLKLMLLSWQMRGIKNLFFENKNRLFLLWPIMKDDWDASIYGATCIDNLLWFELFNEALSEIPYQKMGLYLCESHAWERALIHAWRKQGHGQLIGVAHSTIRFWDLRGFLDIRTIKSTNPFPIPQPDFTALNGKAAMDAFLTLGYPKQAFIECEALRFGHLEKIKLKPREDKANKVIRILILGDYEPSYTIQMLQLLEEAQPHISISVKYTMKCHAGYQVKSSDYPPLDIEMTKDPLEEIIDDFDIVYSTNLTSAAVDAYLAGLKVVVVLNQKEPNYCPLRGRADVCFVNTSEELTEVLQMVEPNKKEFPNSKDFFFLDPELPRWRKLLSAIS